MESQEQVTRSTPRIVNVRAKPAGAMCPEFKRWLFDRVTCPASRDWITQRFERVQ